MSTGQPNPYQPPSYTTQGQWAQAQGPSQVSQALIDSMRKTRPWVMLIAILGSIWAGFMLIGALVLMAAGNSATTGMGFGYLIGVGIYAVPLVMMYRYSGAINRLMHGGGQQELEQAVEAQAGMWQVFGIMTLIGIVLGVLMVIGMIAFVSSVGSRGFGF